MILLLAGFLRIYELGNIPNGFFADEAANGYDSYSVLKTGRSQIGLHFPFFFKHHNVDSISGIYIYSSIPFIFLLDLNEFSTRLAAAIYGILTVLITYFLSYRLLNNRNVALIAALLLAVSVWHIMFSRLALRGITLPFFFSFGLYLLLKGHSKAIYSIVSGIVLGFSFYTYTVARLFLPVFLLGYIFIYKKELLNFKKNGIIFCSTVIIIASPIYLFSLSAEGAKRFNDLSVFSEHNIGKIRFRLQNSNSIKKHIASLPDIFISVSEIAKNYLNFYNPSFLFSKQSGGKLNLLYWFELPFIIYALFLFVRKRKLQHIIILFWFLFYCIPSSLTVPGIVPHRAINGIPVFQILSSYGIIKFFNLSFFNHKINKRIFISFFIVIAFLNIFFTLQFYFGEYQKRTAEHRQYGIREAITYTESVKSKYDQIIFSQNIHNSYSLILFYLKYDPKEYLSNPKMVILKTPQNILIEIHELGKYKIKDVEQICRNANKNLIVVKSDEKIKGKPKKIILYPDTEPAIKIY